MASRKQPTLPPSEPYSPGDIPSGHAMINSAMALSQELERIGSQLGGLDHLERISDLLESHVELSRIRMALEAMVLLTASADLAPTLRDKAVIASTRIASLQP